MCQTLTRHLAGSPEKRPAEPSHSAGLCHSRSAKTQEGTAPPLLSHVRTGSSEPLQRLQGPHDRPAGCAEQDRHDADAGGDRSSERWCLVAWGAASRRQRRPRSRMRWRTGSSARRAAVADRPPLQDPLTVCVGRQRSCALDVLHAHSRLAPLCFVLNPRRGFVSTRFGSWDPSVLPAPIAKASQLL